MYSRIGNNSTASGCVSSDFTQFFRKNHTFSPKTVRPAARHYAGSYAHALLRGRGRDRRKGDRKHAALAEYALCGYAAAHHFGYGFGDRKSQSRRAFLSAAGFVAAVETVEDMRQVLFAYADAVVDAMEQKGTSYAAR